MRLNHIDVEGYTYYKNHEKRRKAAPHIQQPICTKIKSLRMYFNV